LTPEDHDIVREHDQQQFVALAPAGFPAEGVAEIAFDHREDRFNLPTRIAKRQWEAKTIPQQLISPSHPGRTFSDAARPANASPQAQPTGSWSLS
jgi:hypothetical protein